MKKLSAYLFVFTILLTACAASPQESPTSTSTESNSETWVENPTTEDLQFVKRYTPTVHIDDALPTLVLVPGGGGNSTKFEEDRTSAQELANEGYIVITFDPLGSGQSQGEEDYNGYADQDGLNAIIESLDAEEVGLITFSYGVTMGSGMLARYPDSPVDFLIDWEGPADRTDTGGCDSSNVGHMSKLEKCDDEEYWAEREAVTFISQIEVPYHRVQSTKDHAQPDNVHVLKLLNAALNGKSDWVRINDGEVNAVYENESELPLIKISRDRPLMLLLADYSRELFAN